MMNPEEIREVEDIAGFTRINLLPSRSTTRTTIEEARLAEGESSVSTASTGQIGIEEDGIKMRAEEERVSQNTSQKDIPSFEENIVKLTNQIEEALEKAAQMHGEEGRFWKNIAEQYQTAADYKRKALEAHNLGKEYEGRSHAGIADYIYLSIDIKFKVKEARKAGKETLAAEYENIVQILHEAVYCLKQSLISYADGKDLGTFNWYDAGKSFQSSIDYRIKACEAEESGKLALATGYREAAAISEIGANQRKLAAESHVAAQKFSNSTCYDEETLFIISYVGRKDNEGFSWGWGGKALQFQADYQAKAYEAEEVGKLILAAGYREVATTLQYAAGLWKLSAEAYAAGKDDAGLGWSSAGRRFKYQADYQAKACEAVEEGEVVLAAHYRELAVKSEHVADQRKLAAQAYAADQRTLSEQISAAGKKTEGNSWYWTGKSYFLQADYQEKMMKAQEEGKEILAASYREAIETLQRAVEYCQQAVQAFALGNEEEGERWLNMGMLSYSKAETQVKTVEKI